MYGACGVGVLAAIAAYRVTENLPTAFPLGSIVFPVVNYRAAGL